MMVRTQVALDPEQHRRAKRRAGEMGISLAEYVRQAIDRELTREEEGTGGDVSALFGIFESEGSDVARHKDAYLDRAFADEAGAVPDASRTGTDGSSAPA